MQWADKLGKWWRSEAERHFLWLPVGFAGGIALYFALPVEPPRMLLAGMVVLALVAAIATRRFWRPAFPFALAALLITGGALWTQLDAAQKRQVILSEALSPRPLQGMLEDIERTEHGVRFTLDHVTIEGIAPEKTPRTVRLSLRLKPDSDLAWPHIGERISLRAGLLPPMGPALPHGFDFARYFFFRGIGGVGYGLPPWQVLDSPHTNSFRQRFLNWRFGLTDSIIRELGPHDGPIAAGLITGEARAIPQADFAAFRASNLYHIIAISGEHMVVVGGAIFFALRLLLLAFPLGQKPLGKSIAACVTLVLTTLYLGVTGMPISAVRAYIMMALVLLAIIAGRRPNGMRSLAIAFWLMLLVQPADLFDPGFELSFAASMALIALIESAWYPTVGKRETLAGTVAQTFWLMALATIVAEAATTPLVISLFNNVSLYGVLANLIATPLVSFYLMPTVALYFLLLPFGLQIVALRLMDVGIAALLNIARTIADWPHAQLFSPALPGWGTALFALGLCWLCLWRGRARRLGVIAMLLGLASLLTLRQPDILLGPQLKQVALRMPYGFVLARGRSNSMLTTMWANGTGKLILSKIDDDDPRWRCDDAGCIATLKHRRIAFPADPSAVQEDCAQAALIVTMLPDAACDQTPLINADDFAKGGVHAVWLRRAIYIEDSAQWQGRRPWSAVVDGNDD